MDKEYLERLDNSNHKMFIMSLVILAISLGIVLGAFVMVVRTTAIVTEASTEFQRLYFTTDYYYPEPDITQSVDIKQGVED